MESCIDYQRRIMGFLKQCLVGLKPTWAVSSPWCLLLLVLFNVCLYMYMAANHPHAGHENIFEIIPGKSQLESNGIAYYYLEIYIKSLGFTSDLVLRSITIFFSLGAIVLVYHCGKMLTGPRTGLICAWIVSIIGIHVAIAVYNRFYACNEFFCALATYFIIKAITKERWQWWLAYATSIFLCITTMVTSSALMVVHAFIMVWRVRQRRAWLAFVLVVFLGVLVFVLLVFRDPHAYQRFNYRPFSLSLYVDYWLHHNYIFAYQGEGHGEGQLPWQYPRVIETILASVLLIAGASLIKNHNERSVPIVSGLFWGFVAVSLALMWFSSSVKNIIDHVNMSWMIPVVACSVGWTLSRYRVLLYGLALAVMLNPLDCTGSYDFAAYNSISYSFIARNWHKDDVMLLDATCANHLESKLQSDLIFVTNTPSRYLYDSLRIAQGRTSTRILYTSKEQIYRILRYVDTTNRLTCGRLWVAYVEDGNKRSSIIDLAIRELIRTQKYVVVHSTLFKDWENQVLLFAPIYSDSVTTPKR